MNSLPIPPLVPILIGINKYQELEELETAAGDADNFQKFLTKEFSIPKDQITIMKDADATRDKIIDTLSSLQQSYQRNNAILFFFSGYSGKMKSVPGGPGGCICPTDYRQTPGITDQELIELFDSISKARGNNIVSNLNLHAEKNARILSRHLDCLSGEPVYLIHMGKSKFLRCYCTQRCDPNQGRRKVHQIRYGSLA